MSILINSKKSTRGRVNASTHANHPSRQQSFTTMVTSPYNTRSSTARFDKHQRDALLNADELRLENETLNEKLITKNEHQKKVNDEMRQMKQRLKEKDLIIKFLVMSLVASLFEILGRRYH